MRSKTTCLFEVLLISFKFEKFEVLMFGLHVVDKSFEYFLLRYLNLRSSLRIQLKRKLGDLRFIGVSSFISKKPFGVG